MEKKINLLKKKILKILKLPNCDLDVFLLPHAAMKELKARFFKKQTEPNVLSFVEPVNFPHPEFRSSPPRRRGTAPLKREYLGEIYLNKSILRKSPDRAAPLLTHGILHLLGYDHKKKKNIIKMEKNEKRILSKIDKPKIKE